MNNKNYTRVPLNEIALMINAKSGFNIENLIFRARIEYIRDPDKINADNYSIRLYKEGINVNGFLQSSKNIGSILESISTKEEVEIMGNIELGEGNAFLRIEQINRILYKEK
ncbi:hypothetical protein J4440_01435 [Candidatus Woesearchaeota archaeon]|nr:hypothetical protein [Candidatus Woesearchaeota archaeon]